MSTYILKINERSSKAKILLRYIKELANQEDFLELTENKTAVSPTKKKAYNEETQNALKSKRSIKINNVDEFFDSI